MKGLFVGGPWHGTVRETPEKQYVIQVPRLDPGGMVVRRQYRREQVATGEVDGAVTVEAWLYDDFSSLTPNVDRKLADALLRVVIRNELVGYRFTERADWYLEPPPELAEVERCTPTVYAQQLLEEEAARRRQRQEEVEQQIQRLVDAGIPRSVIQPNGEYDHPQEPS
jgi:hypothetical protein